MLEEPKKKEKWWKRLWKDPVGSNLIAAFIGALAVLLWSYIQLWYSKIPIRQTLKSFLLYPVPVWVLLTLVALALIIKSIPSRKRNSFIDGHQQIGDFTFFELYLILSKIQIPRLDSFKGTEKHSVPVLYIFPRYKRRLNTGIEDGWDLYFSEFLGPILLNYKLVSLIPEEYTPANPVARYYRLTEAGNRFLVLYERYNLFTDLQKRRLA